MDDDDTKSKKGVLDRNMSMRSGVSAAPLLVEELAALQAQNAAEQHHTVHVPGTVLSGGGGPEGAKPSVVGKKGGLKKGIMKAAALLTMGSPGEDSAAGSHVGSKVADPAALAAQQFAIKVRWALLVPAA